MALQAVEQEKEARLLLECCVQTVWEVVPARTDGPPRECDLPHEARTLLAAAQVLLGRLLEW